MTQIGAIHLCERTACLRLHGLDANVSIACALDLGYESRSKSANKEREDNSNIYGLETNDVETRLGRIEKSNELPEAGMFILNEQLGMFLW